MKFCTRCGSKLNEEGKCINCDQQTGVSNSKIIKSKNFGKEENQIPEEYIEKKDIIKQNQTENIDARKSKKQKNKKKGKKALIIIMGILSLYTVAFITISSLVYFDVLKVPFLNDIFIHMGIKEESAPVPQEQPQAEQPETQPEVAPENTDVEDNDSPDKYKVTPPDADEYFKNNAQVVTTVLVKDSQDVHTESEAYDNITDRGFNQYPITTNYSITGEYTDDVEISSYSSTKHPMYQTWYMTNSGKLWIIIEINGVVMANLFSEDGSQIVTVSETNTITSYDSTKNKFYVNTPSASVMNIIQVDTLDAAALEALN